MRAIFNLSLCVALVAGIAVVSSRGLGGASPSAAVMARQAPPAPDPRPPQPRGGARKIDEFGEIYTSDWLARADNLAIELQSVPGARGLIVVYAVPNKFPGWPRRRANWAKGYMVKARGLDEGRIEVVDGGYRDSVMFQLWVVEPGAESPVVPFDLAAELAREKTPFLFDQLFTPAPARVDAYGDYAEYLDEKGFYEPFVHALRSDPASRGLIIAYATRRDRPGADRRHAMRRKKALMTTHTIGADRIVAVGGGLRKQKTLEFWIVPPGSPLPKPTPTVRPARRR